MRASLGSPALLSSSYPPFCVVRIHSETELTFRAYVEIYRAEPARRRECLYYLALGHYKMGNYEEARRFNGEYYTRCAPRPRPADTLAFLSSLSMVFVPPTPACLVPPIMQPCCSIRSRQIFRHKAWLG